MQYDIYFATNRLSITASPEGGFIILPDAECTIRRATLLSLFERHSWVTIHAPNDESCEELFAAFAAQFTMVTAAGGIVQRHDEAILMIYRNRRWDLPKGHWEEGETIEECAVREVEEECGISQITLHEPICQTLHSYYMHGRWELKRTHWYAMQSNDPTPLTPQTEEGIERAEWLTPDQVQHSTQGSFPTIKDVLRHYYSRASK